MKPKHFSGVLLKSLLWLGLAALVACGKSAAAPGGFVDKGVATPAGQYPIVKEGTEPITLEIFTSSYDQRTDGPFKIDQANVFIQWLQKKTGVSLNFITVNAENRTERVNVMMATGDVPDIMIASGLSESEINYYGGNGLFRSFTPYIEKYGSVIKEIFEAKPVARPMSSDLKGNIYALPHITSCYHCFLGPKAWYYKPWLDKLGLKVPQTTEQFYEMLVAFKTQDPNGNGKADEIPLTGSNTGWDDSDIFVFLAGSFLYTTDPGAKAGLILNSGRVVAANASPEYRELLRYLNRLYSEGLITDLTFTMSAADYKRTVQGSNPPIVGAAFSQYPGVFADFVKPGDRGYEGFYPLSPLEGPKGIRYANKYHPYVGVNGSAIMSASNPYPALTFRLLETVMTPEGTLSALVGKEGVDYFVAPAGTKTLDGEDATWVRYDPQNPGETLEVTNNPMPTRWNTVLINDSEKFDFGTKFGPMPEKQNVANPDRDGYENILQSSSEQNYEPYNAPVSLMLPPLVIADAFADEVEDLSRAIDEYIEIESVKFVRGKKSIETDWETYLRDLDGLGLPRYLEIYQQMYDEQKERWAAVQ